MFNQKIGSAGDKNEDLISSRRPALRSKLTKNSKFPDTNTSVLRIYVNIRLTHI